MSCDSVCLEATVLQGASSNAVLQGASDSAVGHVLADICNAVLDCAKSFTLVSCIVVCHNWLL